MAASPSDVSRVQSYIRANWHRSVRRDTEPVMGVVLPHPYTTPCVTGSFTFFFYWDTYFTNLGLTPHGEMEAAWRLAQKYVDVSVALTEHLGLG